MSAITDSRNINAVTLCWISVGYTIGCVNIPFPDESGRLSEREDPHERGKCEHSLLPIKTLEELI